MPSLIITLEWIDYGLIAAGGLLLLILAGYWWITGRRDPLRGSPIRPNTLSPVLVWLCIAYTVVLMLGGVMGNTAGDETLDVNKQTIRQALLAVNIIQVFMIIACLAVARIAFTSGWRGFGIGRCPIGTEIVWSVGGWLSAICLCGLTLLATEYVIDKLQYKPPEHGVFTTLKDPQVALWIQIMALVGAAFLAPLGEELFFRGIMQTGIKKLMFPRPRSMRHRWAAITITALLFGGMHSSMPHHIPALVVLGMILGYLYERRGSLIIPILVHMMFNWKSLLWYELGMLWELHHHWAG